MNNLPALLQALVLALLQVGIALASAQPSVEMAGGGASLSLLAERPVLGANLKPNFGEYRVLSTTTATITAYTSDPAETDDSPNYSADGKFVYSGLIACPRVYPFGTKIIIAGERHHCGDRTALKYNGRIDVWMASKEEAINWGRQEMIIGIEYIPK